MERFIAKRAIFTYWENPKGSGQEVTLKFEGLGDGDLRTLFIKHHMFAWVRMYMCVCEEVSYINIK